MIYPHSNKWSIHIINSIKLPIENKRDNVVIYNLSSNRILLFFINYQLSIHSFIESNHPFSSTNQSTSPKTLIEINAPPKTANTPTPGINANVAVAKADTP